MSQPAWKKHHFWILAGVAPVLVLVAVLFLMLNVQSTAAKAIEETEGKLKSVEGVQPQGKKILTDYEVQEEKLDVQKKKLWQARWDQQKDLFTFPTTNPLLKAYLARHTTFGEPLRGANDEKSIFKETRVYQGAYEKMSKIVEPTIFAGGTWAAVLRHVTDWTDRIPTDDQIWLALEDFWVQRGLLEPIKAVNDNAAEFVRLDDGITAPTDPTVLKASFKSRIWRVDLNVNQADQMIYTTLTNHTERLQPFGEGNKLRLLVKLSERGSPIELNIEGDFLKAGHSIKVTKEPKKGENPDADSKIREVPAKSINHGLPPGVQVDKIVSVTQVLDLRTVPIRRIDRIVLSYVDSRHALPVGQKLETPAFIVEPEAVEGGEGLDDFGEGSEFGSDAGSPEFGAPPPGMMGGFGGESAAATGAQFGLPTAVLDQNKNRYIQRTGQVRRIPVAVVLIVDQMFMQDVLVEYANSALRFQVTQFHWQRYRGPSITSGSGGGFTGPPSPDSGFGDEFGESGFGGPPPGIGGPPPGIGGPSGFGGTSSGYSGSSAEQASSGLVELSLYGVVNLYNKYDETVPMTEESTDSEE